MRAVPSRAEFLNKRNEIELVELVDSVSDWPSAGTQKCCKFIASMVDRSTANISNITIERKSSALFFGFRFVTDDALIPIDIRIALKLAAQLNKIKFDLKPKMKSKYSETFDN